METTKSSEYSPARLLIPPLWSFNVFHSARCMRRLSDTSSQLVHLLKQQRFLYHQLSKLMQSADAQLAGKSPEHAIRFAQSCAKVVRKLQQLHRKKQTLDTCYQKISHTSDNNERQFIDSLRRQVTHLASQLETACPDFAEVVYGFWHNSTGTKPIKWGAPA